MPNPAATLKRGRLLGIRFATAEAVFELGCVFLQHRSHFPGFFRFLHAHEEHIQQEEQRGCCQSEHLGNVIIGVVGLDAIIGETPGQLKATGVRVTASGLPKCLEAAG